MERVNLNNGVYPNLKILLYGLSGSGKTRLSYSAALDDRCFPAIALNAHGNPVSVSDYARHPDIFTIQKISDLTAVHDFLKRGCPPDHVFAKKVGIDYEKQGPYKCVILDGISEIQRIAAAKIRGGKVDDIAAEPNPLGRPGFYKLLDQTTRITSWMYDLNMHVIFTALEIDTAAEGEMPKTHPQLLGQSAREVPSYAVITGRMMQSNQITKIQKKILSTRKIEVPLRTASMAIFEQIGRMEAKDATGALPSAMVNPTITQMLDLIEKGGDAS